MEYSLIDLALTMFRCTEIIGWALLFIILPLWLLAILKVIEYCEK